MKQNVEHCDEVNRLRKMIRNNGLDLDATPFSEGQEGLTNYALDNDDYGVELPVGVAYTAPWG
uniref:Uncharacterized protein n=1 Tax=Nelumbo nucifera TaxID=4432 RepID=A0A822YR88_NELNU|nr:TPA_asm: hypothetical protein HUJ06_007355 [Nelumbo nucifera]